MKLEKKSKTAPKSNSGKKEIINSIKNEEEIIIKLNKYFYNWENNKLMKYSLNRANKSRKDNNIHSMSFNCYASYCRKS